VPQGFVILSRDGRGKRKPADAHLALYTGELPAGSVRIARHRTIGNSGFSYTVVLFIWQELPYFSNPVFTFS